MNQISLNKFIPGTIWFFVVLVLICLPKQDIPEVNDWFHKIQIDKWVHAGMFAVLAFLFMFPFYRSGWNEQRKKEILIIIALLASLWGLATECIQLFVPGRDFDLLDWGADSVGAFLALIWSRRQLTA